MALRMDRIGKGFLFLLLILLSSSWAYAAEMETVLVPPKGTVQAGQQVTFGLIFTNLSGQDMDINLPEKLPCHISAGGKEQLVFAVPIDSKAVGKTLADIISICLHSPDSIRLAMVKRNIRWSSGLWE